VHSSVVQYQMWQGLRLVARDEATKGLAWWQKPELAKVPAETRERWRQGDEHLAAADALGLVRGPRIPRERSWVALAESRLDDSAAFLEEAIRQGPETSAMQFELAHVNVLRGKTEAAIQSLRRSIALHPHNLEARGLLVYVLSERTGDLK